jgi:hypothetical protein
MSSIWSSLALCEFRITNDWRLRAASPNRTYSFLKIVTEFPKALQRQT